MAETARRPKMITQEGEPVVHFDADAIEEEANEAPFAFSLAGKVFTLESPETADWIANDELGSPGGMQGFMRELLGDRYEEFAKLRCSQTRLNKIVQACQRHYGITRGESEASARSSNGTRGQ